MTTSIKVLGTGCPKCKQTTSLVNEVVRESGIQATVQKVEDIMEIMKYDVMSTPAVVINEEVMIKGHVPSKQEIMDAFQSKITGSDDPSDNCCSEEGCCQ
ncbi:MAG: thioredoxin family protein [Bacteroidetes bacterium]|nr:thioredoxin family protein [Bacteroidota bacterium]